MFDEANFELNQVYVFIIYLFSGPSLVGCVWSNCSCTKTCADLAEHEIESCTEETCKPGWACPPGLVLHKNKLVSPVFECPCYHNQTFYKVSSHQSR